MTFANPKLEKLSTELHSTLAEIQDEQSRTRTSDESTVDALEHLTADIAEWDRTARAIENLPDDAEPVVALCERADRLNSALLDLRTK